MGILPIASTPRTGARIRQSGSDLGRLASCRPFQLAISRLDEKELRRPADCYKSTTCRAQKHPFLLLLLALNRIAKSGSQTRLGPRGRYGAITPVFYRAFSSP